MLVSVAEPVLKTASSPSVPKEGLAVFLDSLKNYAVLRNHRDIWSGFSHKGDIDLLVSDLDEASCQLQKAVGTPLWCTQRSYVQSFFYQWGHIDLLPGLQWHGAPFIETERVLRDAIQPADGVPYPRAAHEALVSWLTSLLFGGFFKERYKETILQAAVTDGEEFERALVWALGPKWGERLWQLLQTGNPEKSEQHAPALRRALWWRSFRRQPAGTLRRWASYWRTEVSLRWQPPAPMVAVIGPDGSGKSSVLRESTAILDQTLHQIEFHHWYPRFFRFAQIQNGPVLEPHGRKPRSRVVSIAKLLFMAFDSNLCSWVRLVHHRAKNTLLIFDRYYLDLAIDPMRYRFQGPGWLVRQVGKLVPQPDLYILLDAPAEVLQSRKREVSLAESIRQRQAYFDVVSKMKNGIVLDASRPLDEVVAQVNSAILQPWQ